MSLIRRQPLQKVLKTWLKENQKKARAWLYGSDGMLYVRRTEHWIEDLHRSCIDIGSIEINKKSQGVFTALLTDLIKTADTEAIYVESVLNERLVKYLLKRGFKQVNAYEPSFYYLRREIPTMDINW